jgi:hypothetical protein
MRKFDSGPATRTAQPLMIAVVGPSGSGKTQSSLELAEGIQRVTPGPIVVIDTEAKRALKHANGNPNRFIHVPFSPPFGPLDYIDAFKYAVTLNPSTVIVDSMSYEHDGPGGVLEQHAAVVEAKGDKHKMTAWIKPKADHNAMKHFILQQRCHWIFCFRAKEKTKPDASGKPQDLGWQPLGAEDLIYEMDLCALLYPGVDGRPRWKSQLQHEQALMKLPAWFRGIFEHDPQLNAGIGERLARWAAGDDMPATATSTPRTLAERFDACIDRRSFFELDAEMNADWKKIPAADKSNITASFRSASARIKKIEAEAAKVSEPPPIGPEEAAEIARREASS